MVFGGMIVKLGDIRRKGGGRWVKEKRDEGLVGIKEEEIS